VAGQYAKGTEVSTDRSLAEIRNTLRRYGASQYMFAEDEGLAIIGFAMHDRQVRFVLRLPSPNERRFLKTPTNRDRTASSAREEYEKAVRQIYRVFALVIKAKLEAVESGLVEFQTEFLAQLVLPGGVTVGEVVGERINEAYATGQVPALLPDYGRRAITAGGA
jgi:hypothetical protein